MMKIILEESNDKEGFFPQKHLQEERGPFPMRVIWSHEADEKRKHQSNSEVIEASGGVDEREVLFADQLSTSRDSDSVQSVCNYHETVAELSDRGPILRDEHQNQEANGHGSLRDGRGDNGSKAFSEE